MTPKLYHPKPKLTLTDSDETIGMERSPSTRKTGACRGPRRLRSTSFPPEQD